MMTDTEKHSAFARQSRQRISLLALADVTPTEQSADERFESIVWAYGRRIMYRPLVA